jgi:hypothetical protein
MKKIVALVAVLFSVIVPVQASGANPKALVIIDSYFDSRAINGNATCTTLIDTPCLDIVTQIPTLVSSDINHGDAMVEVAKRQSSTLPIIALRVGTASKNSVTAVNAGNFIDALRWVDKNSSKVGAVSISRYFNGSTVCSPASTNTATYGGVTGADATIKSLISTLKSKGIQVFASTGNTRGTKIDYPACILDTTSVSVGATNNAGVIISNYAADSNTDLFADMNIYSYKSTVFGLVAQTTSSATAAVAATWLVKSGTTTKVVPVLP